MSEENLRKFNENSDFFFSLLSAIIADTQERQVEKRPTRNVNKDIQGRPRSQQKEEIRARLFKTNDIVS